MEFTEYCPVTFRLVVGSGPIYLFGNVEIGWRCINYLLLLLYINYLFIIYYYIFYCFSYLGYFYLLWLLFSVIFIYCYSYSLLFYLLLLLFTIIFIWCYSYSLLFLFTVTLIYSYFYILLLLFTDIFTYYDSHLLGFYVVFILLIVPYIICNFYQYILVGLYCSKIRENKRIIDYKPNNILHCPNR